MKTEQLNETLLEHREERFIFFGELWQMMCDR